MHRIFVNDIKKIAVFAIYSDELGPRTVLSKSFSFRKSFLKKGQNIQAAIVLSMAIAQGSYYNYGFYGPLPLLDLPHKVYLYASSLKREKLERKQYIVLALTVPGHIRLSFLPGILDEIPLIMESYLSKNQKIAQITPKSLKLLENAMKTLFYIRNFEYL